MMKTTSTISRLIAIFVVVFCFSSCGGIQNAINPAGPNAGNISKLWWLMFYVCSAVYVLVMIGLFVSLRRATAEAADRVPLVEPSQESEHRRRNVVLSATTITVIVLFVFLIASYSSGRSLRLNDPTKNGLSIELTGHQWWWEARYMDVDASNIFITANEIHIPVGVPVMFTLRGADVIHSFWVPNLSGKKDLIPGKINTIWLQADKPGVYRGQCAEYCGLQHAKMALWVVAEPPEQFFAWRQNQTQQAVAPASDTQKHGQQVFFGSTCVMCHAISGTPAGSNIGPNLTHVGSRQMLAAATLVNTRDHMAQWIKDSQTFKPGNKMPQHNFSDADLQSLVEYLENLK
jgi:cytochrome c oxidase subunit 2